MEDMNRERLGDAAQQALALKRVLHRVIMAQDSAAVRDELRAVGEMFEEVFHRLYDLQHNKELT